MKNFHDIWVRGRRYAALAVNLAIVVMEIIATLHVFLQSGFGMLQFYTVDSNLIALCFSLCYLLYFFRRPKPLWLSFGRYLATVNLMLTLLVALFVLSPSMGGIDRMMFQGDVLYHHTICPILSLTGYVLFEDDLPQRPRFSWLALIPTGIYAAVMIVLNVMKLADGPYPFLHVYEQPVWASVLWCVGIFAAVTALAAAVYRLAERSRAGDPA